MTKSALLAFLLAAAPLPSVADDTLVCLNLDWMLSVRGGIEHRLDSRLGFKGDLGVSIMGLLTADAFFVAYFLPPESDFRLNLLIGVPNAGVPLSFTAAMVSFGGSLQFGFHLTENVLMDIRLGAGFPLFFEEDKDVIRDIAFPLDLWPDLTVSVDF
jgi:hypothetical protein